MRGLFTRTAALALCVTVALGAAAVPCAASDAPATKGSNLTKLSPASRQVLANAAPASLLASPLASPKLRSSEGRPAQPPATPAAPSSFFKSTRGKVTLVLMGAGAGLTIWSINHDRKPVKSPVR